MFRPIALCLLGANILMAQAAPGGIKVVPPAQASTSVTKPRSNVKDNLVVAQPDGRLKCTLPNGNGCSDEDLKGVSVVGLKAVTKGGQQGFIVCETTGGKACSQQQVEALSAAIAAKYDLKAGKI
jgi:hypothetical protein